MQLIFEELPLNPAADPATPVAAAPTPAAGTSLPNLLVNLNTAPAESLVLVPYIGEVLSQRIIEYREQYGGIRLGGAACGYPWYWSKKTSRNSVAISLLSEQAGKRTQHTFGLKKGMCHRRLKGCPLFGKGK